MDREDLIGHFQTVSSAQRAENWQFVENTAARWTGERTVAQVIDAVEETGLVASPIFSFEEILRDPHFQEREMVAEVDRPTAGPLKLFGVASKYSLTPARVRIPPPLLGQHNTEIYGGWLALGDKEMQRLKYQGVI
jgi:crotonobetainyl-CoA:carnitine CoA-transferase CaiB-like acyl-CoA transferase